MSTGSFLNAAITRSHFLNISFIVGVLIGGIGRVNAQVQRYPANVTPMIAAPYSVYLSDYMQPASQKFVASVLFNDFNEPSWTFKLRLSIESANVSLESRTDYTPTTPITVMPGVPYAFSGSEWAEYFDFDNLLVKGRDVQTIINSGRLPEGMYSFCLQVLDYATNDPLSAEICQTVWIQLMDPPRVISPTCASFLDPFSAQHPFTWQMVNTISPNDAMGTQYQLTLWEVTEAGANPLSAVANGQALEVYRSDLLSMGNFIYGPTEPLLESGKVYIYQIQGFDPDGKDRFKNNGKSEFCYFYYGWSTGGKIEQVRPAYGASFNRNVKASLQWTTPDNKAPPQAVNYEVTVKEFDDGQSPEDAIVENPIWHYYLFDPTHLKLLFNADLPFPEVEKNYSWQIKAFTDGIEVAKSDVSVFHGPPAVEQFYAGTHRIVVDKLTSSDVQNLSGTARIRLQKTNIWTDFSFEDLEIVDKGGMLFLGKGEIFIDTEPIVFEMTPTLEENGKGKFEATRYRINNKGLYVEGSFTWDLPFTLLSGNKGKLRSKKLWCSFNNFSITDILDVDVGNSFELLDPYGFELNVSNTSQVFINNNRYTFKLNGTVSPASVKTITGNTAAWTFVEQDQLLMMASQGLTSATPLQLVNQTRMELLPSASIIDLSDNTSPGNHSSDPYWKGVYLEGYELTCRRNLDSRGQFSLDKSWNAYIEPNQAPGSLAWITSAGFTLKQELVFNRDSSQFHSFQSTIGRLNLDITNSNINPATRIYGNFFIPFISTTNPVAFEVPADNTGFKNGFITNLSGTSLRFNPAGGELAVDVSVKKADLEENSLRMTLDVTWPSLGIEMRGLSNFHVWSDHTIGFYTREGIVALPNQVQATFRGYPVTVDALSAGRNKDYYGIAVSGKVVMGDDVAGDDGPPAFNLYSLSQNPLLTSDYIPTATQTAIKLDDGSDLEAKEAELAALEEGLSQQIEEQTAALESTTIDLIASAAGGLGGQEHSAEEIVAVSEEEESDVESIQNNKERLIALLEAWREVAENPSAVDNIIQQIRDSEEDFDSASDIVTELKRLATSFAIDQVASLGDGFLEKVDKTTHDINSTIVREISDITTKVHQELESAVGTIVTAASADVIASLATEAPDASLMVEQIATSTKEAIVNEAVIALNTSVNQNVIFPVTSFVSQNLSERAHRLVYQTAEKVVLGALSRDQNPSDVMKEVLGGFADELQGLGEELAGQVDLDKAFETTKKLGQDIVANISAQRIVNSIRQGALEAVAGYVAAKTSETISDAANNLLSDQLDIGIPVDFGAAGAKLLAGGSVKDLLFDPIPIKVRSPTFELNGLIHFAKGHPQYGDMFAGDIMANVLVPSSFQIRVVYMNGRKDGTSFWMAEVGSAVAAAEEGQAPDLTKASGSLGKETLKETTSQIELGVVKIMAIQGRVYHHMSADKLASIIPDAGNKYGAYLHMVGYGPQNGKMLRLEIDASMNVATTGDYTMAFDGNAQLLSLNPQITSIDDDAVIQGTITLQYNSAEKHFYGLVAAVFEKPGVLCAQGSLLVDVKPGQWRIALGSMDERLKFVLNCAGFGPTGWLDLNQNMANLGLGLEFMFRPDPIAINLLAARISLLLEAGAAAGIQATAQYNPNFVLMEAGLWLEVYASVILGYETPARKGTINLIDIYLAANANMRFNPSPTLLYGRLNGHIQIAIFQFSIDNEFMMNM